LGVLDRAINGGAVSTLKFSSVAGGNIDTELGTIGGASVITSGVQAIGHAIYIDDTTLRQFRRALKNLVRPVCA
jgi:hypothetical protein